MHEYNSRMNELKKAFNEEKENLENEINEINEDLKTMYSDECLKNELSEKKKMFKERH